MEFIYVKGCEGEFPYSMQQDQGVLRVVPLEAITYLEFFFDTEMLKSKKRKVWEAVTGAYLEVEGRVYYTTPSTARRLYLKVSNTALPI